MKLRVDSIALCVAAVMLALAPVAASAAPGNKNLGAARGGAKSSVNRGAGGGGGAGNYNRPNGGNYNKANGGNLAANNNRPGNKAKRGNNVVAGNTVVVGQPNRGGYNNGGRYNNAYNNGYNNGYNNNGNWDNDDNDFLEFVGKTAAITAGASVVASVIGSTTKDKPSDCQQSMSNGQVYMNCNGTWYQPVMNNGQQQYQVIAPPQ